MSEPPTTKPATAYRDYDGWVLFDASRNVVEDWPAGWPKTVDSAFLKAHGVSLGETRGQYRMTIARCRADDTLCGPLHAFDGYATTLCGYAIDENWFSFEESTDRKVTCKRCARLQQRMTQNPKTI